MNFDIITITLNSVQGFNISMNSYPSARGYSFVLSHLISCFLVLFPSPSIPINLSIHQPIHSFLPSFLLSFLPSLVPSFLPCELLIAWLIDWRLIYFLSLQLWDLFSANVEGLRDIIILRFRFVRSVSAFCWSYIDYRQTVNDKLMRSSLSTVKSYITVIYAHFPLSKYRIEYLI